MQYTLRDKFCRKDINLFTQKFTNGMQYGNASVSSLAYLGHRCVCIWRHCLLKQRQEASYQNIILYRSYDAVSMCWSFR